MANEHVEAVPCKPPDLYNSSLEYYTFDSDSWISITADNATENFPYLNSSYYAENFSDLNTSFPFPRSIPLQPPDSLITNPIYLIITSLSILGNMIMVGVILFNPQFRKPANYLIVNLSLSSVLFLLSTNMRMIENAYHTWNYNNFRCGLLAVIHRVPVPCVALTTMVISLDRGRVARNPMNCSSSVSPAWKILFIWTFSLVIVIPLAFTRKYDECIPMAYKCAKVVLFGRSSWSVVYGIVYLLSVHIVPAAILIHEFIKTQKLMRFLKLSSMEHMHQQLQSTIPPYPNTNNFPDIRLRLLRNSCWFLKIFLLFWLPYGVFQFPLDMPKDILPELVRIYVGFYFRFIRNISYLQITLNPVVLFALSYDMRMLVTRVKCDWRYGMGHRNLNNHHRHDFRCNRLDHSQKTGHSLP